MNDAQILVLLVPAARRDEVVDLLMACDHIEGFTRLRAAGFSREHSRFSLREAVQGYEDQERFEVVCPPPVIDELLDSINAIAGRDHFFYWVQPVLRQGRLGMPT
ncbi:MAG: DUF3240 family protein [Halieaceae bacterium]|jgi:hypothetical protein|nr:DUF3240 family protein [Halieaceae bacterium]